MNNSNYNNKATNPKPKYLITALGVLSLALTANAATISYSTSAPVDGDDISNLTGAATAAQNINGGSSDGAGVSGDRPAVGQTFTTGSNAGGYLITSISLQDVTYNTFTNVNQTGPQFGMRITDPSQIGSAAFVLGSETATVTSGLPNNFGFRSNQPGTGNFITFTLDTPITLAANTVYGFDVTGISSNLYFHANGNNSAATYAGGSAYSITGEAIPTPSNYFNDVNPVNVTGDRVFVLDVTAVPEPSTALMMIGGLGMLAALRRRVTSKNCRGLVTER